jgi:hypothetical protein
MRNVWRRMRNRLSQAVVSTCTTLVQTSRPFVCAARCAWLVIVCASVQASLQQLRTRPTRPPVFFRGSSSVSGAFTRQITTDFLTFAREPSLCASACVTWLQGLPCTLVPQTFAFPYEPCSCCCDDCLTNSRTCPIRRAAKVRLPNRTLFVVQQHRQKSCPAHRKRSCDMCALCGFTS